MENEMKKSEKKLTTKQMKKTKGGINVGSPQSLVSAESRVSAESVVGSTATGIVPTIKP